MRLAVKLSCSLLSPVIVIGLLVVYSQIERKEQDFTRRFDSIRLIPSDTLTLPVNSFVFLRADHDQIYLNSRIARRIMMEIDLRTLDTSVINVADHRLNDIDFQEPHVVRTDRNLIFADAATRMILISSDVRHGVFLKRSIPSFSLMLATTDTTFILRTYNNSAQQDILTWIDINSGKRHDNRDILQKQLDGVLCVDGTLLFNRSLRRMVYVYYYRNEFITSDAGLNFVSRGRTIDQTNVVSIKVDSYEHGGERTTTFKAPPEIVNLKCTTDGNYLYVVSNVRAKNQDRKSFSATYTIDRYSLLTMKYEGSFRLTSPKARRELKNFDLIVSDNKLMAIFDEYLIFYDMAVNLTSPLFEQDPK